VIKMDTNLIAILACPICKGKLAYHRDRKELVCQFDKLAYPIKDNIPIMLPEEARKLQEGEK